MKDAFGADRFDRAVSLPGAAGFAVGMPNFPAIYAVRAALDYIKGVSVEKIAEAADPLVQHCLQEIQTQPVQLLTPVNGPLAGILAFRHPKADQIHRELLNRNIHVMSHAGRLRVAIHGYNSHADVESFVAALAEILRRL